MYEWFDSHLPNCGGFTEYFSAARLENYPGILPPQNHTVYPPVIIFEVNSPIPKKKKQLFTGVREISRVSNLFIFSRTSLYFEDFLGHIFVFFTLFQETYLPGFIARHYMILFRCLMTRRIRRKSVGRGSFDTGNNRLLEWENSRIFMFLGYGSANVDLMLIQLA